jgi:putative ABC transport system permease protein
MELAFGFQPAVALVGLVVALAVTLGIGLAGTWRILSVKPAGLLKNL